MKMWQKWLLFTTIFTTTLLASEQVLAQGQAESMTFNSTEMATVILIGIAAGFLNAYQGYRTTPDDFDTLKFFDGVIKASLSSVPLAIGAAVAQTELNLFIYALIFFAAIGISVQWTKSRQTTIPSNASPVEITAALTQRFKRGKLYTTGVEFPEQYAKTVMITQLIRKILDNDYHPTTNPNGLRPDEQIAAIKKLHGITAAEMEALMPTTDHELADTIRKIISPNRAVDRTTKDTT